jgi:hypothetical protein
MAIRRRDFIKVICGAAVAWPLSARAQRAPMPIESAEDPVVGGIRLGMHYSGFVRGKVTDNESKNPGLGVTVAYHGGDQGESTIFIYDKGLSQIPNGPTSQLVRQEFEQEPAHLTAGQSFFAPNSSCRMAAVSSEARQK